METDGEKLSFFEEGEEADVYSEQEGKKKKAQKQEQRLKEAHDRSIPDEEDEYHEDEDNLPPTEETAEQKVDLKKKRAPAREKHEADRQREEEIIRGVREEMAELVIQHKNKEFTATMAAAGFRVSQNQVRNFSFRDPFNPSCSLSGYICRKEGSLGGSLYITHINGRKVRPQLIFGVPKLKYPYLKKKAQLRVYKDFTGKISKFFLANKWNGTNIQFFKYFDLNGNIKISAKTKGSATLSDTGYGDFLHKTFECLGREPSSQKDQDLMRNCPAILKYLTDDKQVQSVSYEICGRDLPHIVKYDFAIALKPLFKTYYDGTIEPIYTGYKEDHGPFDFTQVDCVKMCKNLQQDSLERNEAFRARYNLKHRYEHEHFEIEGHVLYLLNEKGRVIDRSLYKIKPRDVEEVHWEQFDETKEGLVKDALQKIFLREKELNEITLREELEMGPKEWGKFGARIIKYARKIAPDEKTAAHLHKKKGQFKWGGGGGGGGRKKGKATKH